MRETLQTLYKMGLVETLCFIATDSEDWWFTDDNIFMLLHVHGSFSERCKIISANLMGPSK